MLSFTTSLLHGIKQQPQIPIFKPYTRVELLVTADADEKSFCDKGDTELDFVTASSRNLEYHLDFNTQRCNDPTRILKLFRK